MGIASIFIPAEFNPCRDHLLTKSPGQPVSKQKVLYAYADVGILKLELSNYRLISAAGGLSGRVVPAVAW